MSIPYQSDINAILAKRNHNGADYWATPDDRVYVGNPFSTLSCLNMLHELGVAAGHEAVQGAIEVVLRTWRDDGRFRLAPSAPLYPCYTAEAGRVLCRFGYGNDERLQLTAAYLIENATDLGGWRCNFTRFGRGPETLLANPGATLFVLDMLRLTGHHDAGPEIDRAVQSLLTHWDTKTRCGPCHYGIGKRFMLIEYPFLRYNLFYYVYVLSFYAAARGDTRFHAVLQTLQSKLDDTGAVIVEAPHRGLRTLAFCRRGQPSVPATSRFHEIIANVT